MPNIYFRRVKIFRPSPAVESSGALKVGLVAVESSGALKVGLVDYAGLATGNEVLRFSDIPASIQAKSIGNTRHADVPAGSPGPVKWAIFIPKRALAIGSVEDQDIVVDDLGERYQVASAYFNLLGYKLDTIRTSRVEA